jgi:hypothetical protein
VRDYLKTLLIVAVTALVISFVTSMFLLRSVSPEPCPTIEPVERDYVPDPAGDRLLELARKVTPEQWEWLRELGRRQDAGLIP